MLLAGATRQRPDWTGVQEGSPHAARSAVRAVDESTWVFHVASPCCWSFSQDSKKYLYRTSFLSHSIAKTCQGQLKGKEKTLPLHEPLHYLNPSYLWRNKYSKGFIVGTLIPLLFIMKLPLADSVPTMSRETDSLLLDLLQGKNRATISHSDWILT